MTDIIIHLQPRPSTQSRRTRRRENLYRQQGGKCYWCGCQCVLWGPHNPRQLKGPYPPNLATIDHLRDRLHPGRRIPPRNGEQRWVMACATCNHKRGEERVASLTKEQLHELSSRHKKRVAR